MATDKNFIEFVYDQIGGMGNITYKKMFGEYMVYHGVKPVLLICDNTVFVKQLPAVAEKFAEHGVTPMTGLPYTGAREHFILDIENTDLAIDMIRLLSQILPVPKPKKPKVSK